MHVDFTLIYAPIHLRRSVRLLFMSMVKRWTYDSICPIRCHSLGIWIRSGMTQRKTWRFVTTGLPWGDSSMVAGPWSQGRYSGPAFFLQVFLAPKNPNLAFWIFNSWHIPYHCLGSSTAGAGFLGTVQTMKEKLVVSLWFSGFLNHKETTTSIGASLSWFLLGDRLL